MHPCQGTDPLSYVLALHSVIKIVLQFCKENGLNSTYKTLQTECQVRNATKTLRMFALSFVQVRSLERNSVVALWKPDDFSTPKTCVISCNLRVLVGAVIKRVQAL